ncbi:MAG TPA: hypothetical protein VGG05_11755 [Pseudonocardiaceae bacterium]|jgi:hypothetical protein
MAEQIEAVQDRIVELFTELCHDPDNATAARDADEALAELDRMLAAH